MRALAICLLAALPTAAPAVSALSQDEARTLQEGLVTTADAFILPAYQAHSHAAGELVGALRRYCTGEGAAAPVQAAFAATFLAWQRASIVQVGPIAEAEGPMRVQLWPDPKGFSQRALRAALRAEDPALLAPGGLDGRSIALSNLTTLEAMLYPAAPEAGYACDLATAIGSYQADLAADLVASWTPGSAYRRAFDNAAAGNNRYPGVEVPVRQVLAGAVVYVDRLRKFKLQRGLGEAPGDARPERTEARRSGLGLASLQESFRTLAALYDTPFGLFDIAPDIGGTMDYLVLGESASAVADALATMPGTFAEIAEEDGARAAELRRFNDVVLQHEAYLKTGFLAALGLSAGFTAADGD